MGNITKKYHTVGLVARLKPLHIGARAMLEAACENAEHVKIGIGSCNRYDLRNPFTKEESADMVNAILQHLYSNYEILFIPDFAHLDEKFHDGKKWMEFVTTTYGTLDAFITGNDYVKELLLDKYPIIHPAKLIPTEKRIICKATHVRYLMALGDTWRNLVPNEVQNYLDQHHLVERFRKEFGLQTIFYVNDSVKTRLYETAGEEQKHTWGS